MDEKLPTVCVKDWDGNDWNSRLEEVTALNDSSSRIRVILAEDKTLENVYNVPDEFDRIIRGVDINGSFFSDYTIDENDTPTHHVSWATYKAKLVRSEHDYDWVQTTVLVKWKIPSQIEVVFINLEDEQMRDIVERLPKDEKRQLHPFTWHALLGESILGLYNESFWGLRDLVRPIEKKREFTSQPSKDLARQHDIARHIFHLAEVLEVTENTLKNLVSEHRRFREEFADLTKGNRGVIINTQQKLFYVEKEIHSQRMRARSLTERLNNELNLGFNLAAFSESAVMKTIGFVTMIYLPGTFVSGIFGSNFFDFNAPSDGMWATSSKFWMYWAVTVPLTVVTLILWAWWHGMPRKWIKEINYWSEKRKQEKNPREKRTRTDSEIRV